MSEKKSDVKIDNSKLTLPPQVITIESIKYMIENKLITEMQGAVMDMHYFVMKKEADRRAGKESGTCFKSISKTAAQWKVCRQNLHRALDEAGMIREGHQGQKLKRRIWGTLQSVINDDAKVMNQNSDIKMNQNSDIKTKETAAVMNQNSDIHIPQQQASQNYQEEQSTVGSVKTTTYDTSTVSLGVGTDKNTDCQNEGWVDEEETGSDIENGSPQSNGQDVLIELTECSALADYWNNFNTIKYSIEGIKDRKHHYDSENLGSLLSEAREAGFPIWEHFTAIVENFIAHEGDIKYLHTLQLLHYFRQQVIRTEAPIKVR